jgi:flagellar protein FliO/FliZ
MEAFFNTMSVPAKFLLAFIVVLAVLGIGGYLLRRLTGGTLSISGPRGRQPRLAIIDAASVDGRRRLVLVRRDNVEHLLLIGGPTDIVVEPSIDRAALAASAAVHASPALRELTTSPALESLQRASPTYEPISREPLQPMSREPMSREPISREPISRELVSREPMHREPMHREPISRSAATYEPVRPSPAFEPALRPAPVLEETHWPAPEPVAFAPVEPSHMSWPAPEPVAQSPVEPQHTSWPLPEPVAAAPIEQPHTPWPAPEPAALEPVEQAWPAPEAVAVTPVEPAHASWPAPEPIAPAHVEPVAAEPAQALREAAQWPFDEGTIAPPLTPTPVEPEPVIPPPPPPQPAFEPVFETRRMPTAPPLPPRNEQNDASNLTEMAQRLEAALRRPIRPVERAAPPTPHVAIEVPPPEPAPLPAPPLPMRELSVVPQPVAAPEPIASPPRVPAPPIPSPRSAPVFTSIEEEMASLLGRAPGRP